MRTAGVVPLNPFSKRRASLGEAAKVVQQDALFFETTKEALDETVLLGRMGRDELLTQPLITAGGTKAPTLKDQPIIAAQHRHGTFRTNVPEEHQAGLLEGVLGFLR